MRKILKFFLPRTIFKRLGAAKRILHNKIMRFFSKSGFLSSLYYLLFSTKFYREHRAVLLGRIQYERSLSRPGLSFPLLRRNIHRIEKGLIMRPRRPIFGEGYIGETVECYTKAISGRQLCDQERKWAEDVLTEYFSVVGDTAEILRARREFQSVCTSANNISYIPYQHKDLPDCPVNYEQLLTLYKRRRSVRWYDEQVVNVDIIKKAVDAATYAPSACNRQPFRFFVVNNPERATIIAKCAMGTAGFAENIPCVIAIIGDLSAYPAERDRHVIYIDGSLAAMQLMLAFETLGLSTCPINWPDVEERERMLSQELGLAFHERPIMLMSVGYANPEGGVPFSQKKSSDQLVEVILK